MTIIEFEKNKRLFEKAYFCEVTATGISVKNNVSRDFEDRTIVKNHLEKGIIDEVIVAWKAGRLVPNGTNDYVPDTVGDNYLNGYGNHINKDELKNYLSFVSNKWEKQSLDSEEEFETLYKSLAKDSDNPVPKNFGSVYIINLIYFLSKGKWPIYDKFAHKALKALYMGIRPDQVFVGEAPGKDDVKQVVNMYTEYLWLLEKLFGKTDIDRITDRALWAYGHEKQKD